MSWEGRLKADPIPRLLEAENPSVRYWTLCDILDRPADDAEVRQAREAILTYPPVAELLASQKRDGYWVKRDYYLPKFNGTFWTLTVLADLGLTAETEQIRRACEFMFTFQRENGAFCRRRYVSGKGTVWAENPGPCTHARIVRFLIQFGYGGDARTRAGVRWLLENQRDDDMWHCQPKHRYGCLRATLDYLRAAVLDAEMRAHPATTRGGAAVRDLLMSPRMGRYHVSDSWTVLEYPYFDYGLISALDALARCGYAVEDPKVAETVDYLLGRQLPDGAWPLDRIPRHPPFHIGEVGKPNKWLTLDAVRVVKLLYRADG